MKSKLFFIFLLIPNLLFAMTRLNSINQSGFGTDGVVTIEFNDIYDEANLRVSYEKDYAVIHLGNSFVLPIKRVFNPSSPRSSVVRIEAHQKPQSRIEVYIYFRIPLDIVKATSSVEVLDKKVLFKYKTVADTKTIEVKEEISEVKKEIAKDKEVKEVKEKDLIKIDVKENKEFKKSDMGTSVFWKIFKFTLIFVLLLFIGFIFFVVSKKYFNRTPASKYVKEVLDKEESKENIKIISTKSINNKKLHIIEINDGEQILIAEGKNEIAFISKVRISKPSNAIMTEEDELLMRNRLKDKLKNI